MKKAPAKMKKSMAKEKMKMVTVNGKKVPAFAADGKGAGDLKKGAATKLKKSMAKVTAKQKSKLNAGLLAAIKKSEGSAAKMKKAAMLSLIHISEPTRRS